MWAYTPRLPLTAAEPRPAKLTIETHPAGASVAIDGQDRGLAPLSVTLPSGAHTATLRHETEERVLPLMLAAGAEVTHHIEFVTHETVAAATGGISIVTDPPGARVQIDGHQRGLSPLMLTGLAPAEYKVAVSSETGSAGRTISVKPGASASVVFSLPKVSTPLAGWLAVAAPFDVQVLEDGNVVGSGRSSKIMLVAGRHTVALVNESLRYQDVRTIEVTPGRTTPLQVDAPKVTINANARPWADVFIDGSSVGQTPISNVSVTIGTHEIVFRHPQLGERRQTIVVTTQGPNRISLDLTK